MNFMMIKFIGVTVLDIHSFSHFISKNETCFISHK